MKQEMLNRWATDSLRRNIGDNIGKGLYGVGTTWVGELYEGKDIFAQTTIEIEKAPELTPMSGQKHYDLENSIALFLAYKDLTHHQATSDTLWAYLTHIQYWEYMQSRWPITHSSQGKEANYIRERYFLASVTDRALIRNGISRLWWYAKLTYDEAAEDPFHLTRALLSQLDIAQGLLERSWGRNGSILRGFLEFLAEHTELTKGSSRPHTRFLYKSLTLEGGVTIIDVRSKEEIKSFLEQKHAIYKAKRQSEDDETTAE